MEAWSPTSFFNRRACGSENLSPIPQKDFCNSIRQERKLPRSAGLEGRQGLLQMDGSRPGRRFTPRCRAKDLPNDRAADIRFPQGALSRVFLTCVVTTSTGRLCLSVADFFGSVPAQEACEISRLPVGGRLGCAVQRLPLGSDSLRTGPQPTGTLHG